MTSTCDLCDAYGDAVRVLGLPLRDFGGRTAFAGTVSTIQAHEDNSRVCEAVAEPGGGRVLVIDGGGSLRRSMLGDQLAGTAVANRWCGVIVIGAVRDTVALGVKALGSCPRKTDKRGEGRRDVALEIAGITIKPGYWLCADKDGVVIADTAPPFAAS
ncbi:MAG: ribonuclease E activity regulator RraA [Luteimonas sp.]